MGRLLPLATAAAVAGSLLAPPPAASQPAAGGAIATQRALDGDPATTERIHARTATTAAIEVSRSRFGADRRAAWAVLSRDDAFPDALAGSALTGRGPLLFTRTDRLTAATAAEIARVLPGGRTVFLLGGPRAIAPAVAEALRADGYRTVRLAGATRVETALAVADEVRRRSDRTEVLLARAFGPASEPTAAWADAVAAGAVAAASGVPVLVTPSAGLHPAVARWLAADRPSTTFLLGGTAALSAAVERAVPDPVRVAGRDRAGTAAAVARRLWGVAPDGERSFVTVNGRHPQGWAFGFAAAGVAADAGAPVLLVDGDLTPAATTALNGSCGEPEVDLLVVGDGSVVAPRARERLDAYDGDACGPRGTLDVEERLEGTSGCDPLLAAFHEDALERVGPWGLDGPVTIQPVASPEEGGGDTATAPADGGSSSTNVQEEGVDEPDTVETDGATAVVVARDRLQVVDVRGGAPRLLATVALPADTFGHELLLHGSDLLVLSRRFDGSGGPGPEPLPVDRDGGVAASSTLVASGLTTVLTAVDLTVPSAPLVTDTLELDGDLRSARAVDGVARVVLVTPPDDLPFTFPDEPTPEAQEEAAARNRQVVRDSTIEDWLPGHVACGDVRHPPWFAGFSTLSVVTVPIGDELTPTSSAGVVAEGHVVYASQARLVVTTSRWNAGEPDWRGAPATTEVHAFDTADPAATTYLASGTVPGYVLDQFSVSELGGRVRIATTEEAPWRESDGVPASSSSVRVLEGRDGVLVEVGALGGLGEGERILAVRFLGDLAAVVTFRQVDPLYLVDLADPTAPRLLGELKVPGYSAYLHRVDDDHLLGVGQDATEEGQPTGAQVSLFDISDRAAPRLVDRFVEPGAVSEVEFDHHAFLWWPPATRAIVPLTTWTEAGPGFHGAVGLDVAAGGVDEVGRVSHPASDEEERWMAGIRRSFVAGGTLYTVSELGIGASDLATLRLTAFERFASG